MRSNPQKNGRRSIRLQGYDCTREGACFLTICTHGHGPFFGQICDGSVALSAAGRIVEQIWRTLPEHFPNINLDSFVVMPNHFHAIIVITRRGEAFGAKDSDTTKPKMPVISPLLKEDVL